MMKLVVGVHDNHVGEPAVRVRDKEIYSVLWQGHCESILHNESNGCHQCELHGLYNPDSSIQISLRIAANRFHIVHCALEWSHVKFLWVSVDSLAIMISHHMTVLICLVMTVPGYDLQLSRRTYAN